jgi:hypothetical protein
MKAMLGILFTNWYWMHKLLFFLFCFCLNAQFVSGQTKQFNQFSNELQFNKSLKNKFEAEFDIGHLYSSTPPSNNNMFASNSQLYFRGWFHYHISSRWKLSYFYSFYFNHRIPEIDQEDYHEIRSAFQGIYFIHKLGYNLQTRFRVEDRHIQNSSKTYEAFYRLRAQIKYVQPFNSKVFKKGVYYGIVSEELMCKTQALITGAEFFDRNSIAIGLGYCVSSNTQVEVNYMNQYLLRTKGNQVYNGLQLNLKFNGIFEKLKERFRETHAISLIDN